MSELTVKFLGTNYTFPQELKEYVAYCTEFEKINDRLSKALLETMRKKPMSSNNEPSAYNDINTSLKEKMVCEGKSLITLFAKQSIFDITESELIENNKGFILYNNAANIMEEGFRQILLDSMNSWMSDVENASETAYSQITGTGISMYSNSIINHLTFAAFEASTIKKQCKKADSDYEKAIKEINLSNTTNTEKNYANHLVSKVYPEIAKAFGMFVNELMEIYLNKLQEKSIYDYSKVKPYSMKRSSELLNNISMVDDKKSVLEQAFKSCPYNPDIYAKLLELDMCDVDAFATAKEFHQDYLLINAVKDYCKKHLKNYDKIKAPVAILALYENKTETEILRLLYGTELKSIENQYRTLANVLTNQRNLDAWIRKNISQHTKDVISISAENIKNKIHSVINGIISENNYKIFVDMGLISAETLRLDDSAETELMNINAEYEDKILICVNSYIEEATDRKKRYDEAYGLFNLEINNRKNAIADKQKELATLGLFAFSKKKEVKVEIENLEAELSKYKSNNEPKDLQIAFEKMYG